MPDIESDMCGSAELLARYEQGDDVAAEELFRRYVVRLTLLARSRLSPKLASRTDPEDVVLSAYRSFFVAAKAGRFRLVRSGELWKLLVSITMRKLYHQVRSHTAKKRSVESERSLARIPARFLPLANDPTPEQALELADRMEAILESLDLFTRRVFELRLQEETIPSIADRTQRSERTVRRALQRIRELLKLQLETDGTLGQERTVD